MSAALTSMLVNADFLLSIGAYDAPNFLDKGASPGNAMTGRKFIICVGVDRYVDGALPDLKFACSDAEAVYNILLPTLNDQSHALHVVQGTNSVQAMINIREFLRKHKVKSGDMVLFYFAGHGTRPDPNGDHYLLLPNAHVEDLSKGLLAGNDLLSVRALQFEFAKWQAAFVLMLDACRHPAEVGQSPTQEELISRVLAGLSGREFEFAESPTATHRGGLDPLPFANQLIVCGGGECGRAHEVEALGGGLFGRALVHWLDEAIRTAQPALINSEWADKLGARMTSDAASVQIQLAQRPWLSASSPDFVVYVPHPASTRQRNHAKSQGSQNRPNDSFFFGEPWCPRVSAIRLPQGPGKASKAVVITVDPITFMQWLDMMGAHPPAMPKGESIMSNHQPVTWVTCRDAMQYAAELTAKMRNRSGMSIEPFRLLTRREWETACTCGHREPYMIDRQAQSTLSADQAVFRWSHVQKKVRANLVAPVPVDDHRNRFNLWRLRGMHGNVREWATGNLRGPTAYMMGGSFRSSPDELKAHVFSSADVQSAADDDVGFRLVREISEQEFLAFSEGKQT